MKIGTFEKTSMMRSPIAVRVVRKSKHTSVKPI